MIYKANSTQELFTNETVIDVYDQVEAIQNGETTTFLVKKGVTSIAILNKKISDLDIHVIDRIEKINAVADRDIELVNKKRSEAIESATEFGNSEKQKSQNMINEINESVDYA